jgi:hypothetical protein
MDSTIRSTCGFCQGGHHVLHPHALGDGGEVAAIDRISIAKHIFRGMVPLELVAPSILGRVFRHPEVHYTVSGMRQHDEDEQNPECRGWNVKKSITAVSSI